MSCPLLAGTGVPTVALMAVAASCFLAGAALLWLTRDRRGRGGTAITVVLLVLTTCGLTTAIASVSSAHASSRCLLPRRASSSGDQSLAIAQTSSLVGLGPGVAPEPITGIVTNRSPTGTIVTAVTVRIAAVTTTSTATPGSCDASDYVLLDSVMPIGRTLAAGESADFGGARIGFNDKATNQDTCQDAVVDLRYVSS